MIIHTPTAGWHDFTKIRFNPANQNCTGNIHLSEHPCTDAAERKADVAMDHFSEVLPLSILTLFLNTVDFHGYQIHAVDIN